MYSLFLEHYRKLLAMIWLDFDTKGCCDEKLTTLIISGLIIFISFSHQQFIFLFAMASSAMITVPTTASRFALLQIDTDSDSDASDAVKTTTKGGPDSSGKPRQGKAGAAGAKPGHCNDKKKDKKKKKREQQQTEANEVSNMDICRPAASLSGAYTVFVTAQT